MLDNEMNTNNTNCIIKRLESIKDNNKILGINNIIQEVSDMYTKDFDLICSQKNTKGKSKKKNKN